MNDKVKNAIDTLLKAFSDDNLERVAIAVFRSNNGIPSDNWSFCNRLIMLMNDTEDARGFKQWQEVGRKVKKGAKAFYILAPLFKKIKRERVNEDGELEVIEEVVLKGFKPVPVFRIEDTEGKPIIREEFKVNIPFNLKPLIKELGLTIKTEAFKGIYYGAYNLDRKEIKLCSPDLSVLLHELCHAVDHKLHGLKGGQIATQEVVAEFSASVLAYLMGYKIPLGNSKDYIERYSFRELLNCLSRVEKVVNYAIERSGVDAKICPPLTAEVVV